MEKQEIEANIIEDKKMQENENYIFTYSNESYKNEKIMDEKLDLVGDPYEPNYDNVSLFERKKLALDLFNKRESGQNIQLENLLELDNTNKKIQYEYLKLAVAKLLQENNQDKIKVLIEKINKAGIICDEEDYNNVIMNLPNKYKSEVTYVNYKKTLIFSLESLLNRVNEKDFTNENILFKSFQFKKKYYFNHECEPGENNYYFYSLVDQIIISDINPKLKNFDAYRIFIQHIIEFMKSYDYSNPKDIDMNYFEYLFFLLTDHDSIGINTKKYRLIENYINSYKSCFIEKIEISEEKIKEFNNYFIDFKKRNKNHDYSFFVEEGKIKVNIIEEPNINRRDKKFAKTFEYDINMFNKDVLNIIKENLNLDNFKNFESIFTQNVRFGMEYKPSENYIAKFKEILTKILKSNAAKNYFHKYYGRKHIGLVYHFDKDEVIAEIFNRIKFINIFKKGDQAYTSPYELKIFISCSAGKYTDSGINIFERKILQFCRLLTVASHEILGHFLRRYYAFLTNHLVKFGTKEETTFKTGTEGGKFVEKKFLGLDNNISSLSLNEAIGFFKADFKNFPILYTEIIPEDDLKNIIGENGYFFDFISEKEEENKISLDDLYYYLLKGFSPLPRITCGYSRAENIIYIEDPFFLDEY